MSKSHPGSNHNGGTDRTPGRDGESSVEAARSTVNSVMNSNPALRQAKRVIIAVVGGTVLLVGIILLVTPGPAFIVIPAGLGILAIEFRWARRWLRKLKSMVPKRKRPGTQSTAQ